MAENSVLSPVSLTSFFDNATGEARQANLFFYRAQTLDPLTVYTDSTLRIPHAQPVATTGWGRVPPVYVGEIPAPGYRVRTFDQWQTLIEDLDNLPGALPAVPTPDPDNVPPEKLAATGDLKFVWANHAQIAGWLECDGKTLGKDGSGANYQGDVVRDLYFWLWSQDAPRPNNLLPVSGSTGKGDSAQGDWDALRTITLPDVAGRFIAGLDRLDTGATPPASLTKRLDAGLFDKITNPGTTELQLTPWMLGAHGGESVHKLLTAELSVHLHDWWDEIGHTHYVQEPNSGQGHTHGTGSDSHVHGMLMPRGNTTDSLDTSPHYALVATTSTVPGMSLGYTGRVLVAASAGSADVNTAAAAADLTITAAVTGVIMRHANYPATGQPGFGETNARIGVWVPVDNSVTPSVPGHWSQKTRNEGGDTPHNTLPPFIQFAVYIKQ